VSACPFIFFLLNLTHHTSPKAPMPTGCRSEYLSRPLANVILVSCRPRRALGHARNA
jgi:hypothetical protein